MTLRQRRADNEDVARHDRVVVANELTAAPRASLAGSSEPYSWNAFRSLSIWAGRQISDESVSSRDLRICR